MMVIMAGERHRHAFYIRLWYWPIGGRISWQQIQHGAGPLWREFYGALVMSVLPQIQPADM